MKIIDVFICKLRKKLAQAGAGQLIETVWGRGYMIREARAEPVFRAAAAVVAPLPPPASVLAAAA